MWGGDESLHPLIEGSTIMTIRTDLYTIDWTQSPRVIWIDISVLEANTQDFYDTCRWLEAIQTDEPPIIDAGGWEPLGGGVYNGITVSLFNAVYAFADRPGPDWVICNMTGGNVVAFTDDTKTTTIYPRLPTAYVSADRTAASSATIRLGSGQTPEDIADAVWEYGRV
jgi:hypothetical protein